MGITEKIISGLSDKLLVSRAKAGDKEAYGKLYMKYLDQIYRYIYFKVNCLRPESEDLTEAVFIKAWDKLRDGSFRNDNFRAWIYKIAHNTVIDSYRKSKTTVPLNDQATSVSTEDKFIKDSEKQAVIQSLNKLPDEQKQVVTLKFIEGLKNEEIARILHKSNTAVRALSYRALNKLKSEFKES